MGVKKHVTLGPTSAFREDITTVDLADMPPPADLSGRGLGPAADVASSILTTAPNARTNLQSCQFCRKRKIKCDKLEGGCSQCSRAQNECIYPASQRKGRPRKAGTNRPAPVPTPREAQLLKKICNLERLVAHLAGDHLQASGEVNWSVDAMGHLDVDDDSELSGKLLGRLLISKPYLSDTSWSKQLVADALRNLDEESIDEDEDDPIYPSVQGPFLEVFPANFILEDDQPADLKHFHPPSSQTQIYWRLYVEHVEVLFHIFHGPTIRKTVDQAQAGIAGLSKSNELTMFAIYFATIAALSEGQVLSIFGGDKALLLAQYQTAVQMALVNAGFLNTQDLNVLQAFVLYLVALRSRDGTVIWTMIGLAIRMAHGIGAHRDGEVFKLKPFETELRRRIWHQVLILDLRASEARGTFPTQLPYDTKLPLNINDSDIGPETTTYPEPRVGLTDMTVSIVRLQFSDIARLLHKTSSMTAREKMLEEHNNHIETTYIQYFFNEGQLEHWMVLMTRLILKRMMLMLFKRDTSITKATSERLFLASVEVIDLANQLRDSTYARRWDWAIHTGMQWHAMAVVLEELSSLPSSIVTENAWIVIDAIRWEEPEDRAGKILCQSITRLLAKAQAHRESQTKSLQVDTALAEQSQSSHEEAHFAAEAAFDPALMGQNYYGPTNFLNIESHQPAPYFVNQQVPVHNMGQQQPAPEWYFDSTVIQPLSQQEPTLFNTEYWKTWDIMRDDSMHDGSG